MTVKTRTENEPQTGTDNWNEFAKYRGRVVFKEEVANNVHRYVVEKPDGFEFRPGQAVELAIDEKQWRNKKRPFSMTSLPSNPRLEFVIKSYSPNPNGGVTYHLGRDVEVGDRLIFDDAWTSVEYDRPGVFIAGGTGITPFLAIFRELESRGELHGNRLFYSSQTASDVILQGDLFRMLGRSVVCTLSDEHDENYEHGLIDREWLKSRVSDFSQAFYLCGPPSMVRDLAAELESLGASPTAIEFDDEE